MESRPRPGRSGLAPGTEGVTTPTTVTLPPVGSERLLVGASIILALASYAMHLIVRARNVEPLAMLDVGDEVSLPTWYSTLLFAAASMLMVLCGRTAGPLATRCGVLAAVMLACSIDEAVSLHERLGSDLRDLVGAGGILYYIWVVPALMFVAGLGVYLLPWLRSLPRNIERRVIFSGALFVGGAAFLELLAGPEAEARGTGTLLSISLSAVEELMEMLGVSLFIGAILRHLAGSVFPVAITPTPARIPQPPPSELLGERSVPAQIRHQTPDEERAVLLEGPGERVPSRTRRRPDRRRP